jgi:hypothetical protein
LELGEIPGEGFQIPIISENALTGSGFRRERNIEAMQPQAARTSTALRGSNIKTALEVGERGGMHCSL